MVIRYFAVLYNLYKHTLLNIGARIGGTVICFSVWSACSLAQTRPAISLISGQAIRGASPGRFALPSLTGYVMGMAVLKTNGPAALFIQSDKRNVGTYLYFLKGFTHNGAPLFSAGTPLTLPFKETGDNRGIIFQDAKNTIWGAWQFEQSLLLSPFDVNTFTFGQPKRVEVKGLPSRFAGFGINRMANGRYIIVFGVGAKAPKGEPVMDFDSLYYTPEGFWPVSLPHSGLYGATVDDITNTSAINGKQLTELNETYYNFSGYTFYNDAASAYIIAGTRLGNLYAYRIGDGELSLEKHYVVDTSFILHRQPSMHAFPGYAKLAEKREGIIVSGEGGIFYYENTRKMDKKGNLVFKDPLPVMQENPELYGGSLVVPELVDWDGDGQLDIIFGASSGYILFFKNAGSNTVPQFLPPVALKAGGEVIHIQPGYREDIQGPGEARWGYTCPTVYDWNGDGLPDILTGDSRGRFMIFINNGTKTNPRLATEHPLYINGMDMYGGWRVKPGVGELNGKTAYIINDKDNEFHLYWKLDDYNVTEGGKLTIGDSVYIKGGRRPGGQVGRSKFHIVDWDGDGVKDLLVGTGRSASVPNPDTGLPYNRKKKNEGAAVLFLRNSGTEARPVYEFPKMLKYKGKDILLGAHECVPATAYIGEGKTLNLVVGVEEGTFIYYERKDLSW